MGGLLAQGIPAHFSIISDDAGQFNVFDHALCWIHAERIINRLIPLNTVETAAIRRYVFIKNRLLRFLLISLILLSICTYCFTFYAN